MTSSIFFPRRSLARVSPSTHLKASTVLLLPEPLGPTTAVTPASKRSSVRWANVLKPCRVIERRCTVFGRLADVVVHHHLDPNHWGSYELVRSGGMPPRPDSSRARSHAETGDTWSESSRNRKAAQTARGRHLVVCPG